MVQIPDESSTDGSSIDIDSSLPKVCPYKSLYLQP